MQSSKDNNTMPTRAPPIKPKHEYAYCITNIDPAAARTSSERDSEIPQSQRSGFCASCHSACLSVVHLCMTKHNPLTADAGVCQRCNYACMCPMHGYLAKCVTLLSLTVLFWGVLWAVTGLQALPGGNLFSLYVLVVCCVLGGFIVGLVHLPPLLGMLIVGFMLKNIPYIDVANDIHPDLSSALRSIALVVILVHAGLGLDAQALKRLSIVCVRLCCLPCIVEACTVGVVVHFLLGFPWQWGFMLGFVLGAVTPAVIVPTLLSLQDRGYGVTKGIPTLIIAAASADDVLAISAFGVVLGTAFPTGSLVFTVFKGPLELLMGVTFGCVCGVFLWYIPAKDQRASQLTIQRFVMLFGGGLFSVFGSSAAGFPGAGALGALTMAFVAGQKWKQDKEPVVNLVGLSWKLFEPFLFGLIGAAVSIEDLDVNTVGLGIATLCIGLIVRVAASILAVTGAKLNLKEKIFIAIAWLPKATVQAAIGSIAYETAVRQKADPEFLEYGKQVLTIAVLSILLTAPLGAIAIVLTGPRLLQKSDIKELDECDEEEGGSEGYLEPAAEVSGAQRYTGDAIEMQPSARDNDDSKPAEQTTLLKGNGTEEKVKL